MAALTGLSRLVAVPAQPVATGGTQANAVSQPTTALPSVIDGTPVRVVILSVSAAMGLWALHAAGFRFNVAVSA